MALRPPRKRQSQAMILFASSWKTIPIRPRPWHWASAFLSGSPPLGAVEFPSSEIRWFVMPSRAQPQNLDQAIGEAKRQAAQVADVATTAARKTAGSFEVVLRELIET